MTYILNSLIDMCAIPFALVGLVIAIIMAARLAAWALEKRQRLDFERAMHQEEIQAATIENDKKRAELERARADVSLVQIDPTRPTVSRLALEAGQLDQAALMLAMRYLEQWGPVDNVPNTLTYSPHVVYKNDVQNALHGGEQPALPQLMAPAAAAVPSFAELLTGGQLGNGQFLLGYDLANGKQITSGWEGLYSGLAAGQQGSGKTSTVRFLLCQSLLNGADLIVADPHLHYSKESLGQSIAPLSPFLQTEIASDEKQIVSTLRYVNSLVDQRVRALVADHSHQPTPLIVAIDEMVSLFDNETVGSQLYKLMRRLVTEGRKINVFMLGISHVFDAQTMQKGSAVRALLGTRYVHALDATQARILVSNDYAKQAATLQPGQAVLKANMLGTALVQIPYCTTADCELVAQRMTKNRPLLAGGSGGSPSVASGSAGGSETPVFVVGEPVSEPLANQSTNHPQREQIRNLVRLGYSQNQIIAEAFGVTGKGEAYQTAARELRLILAELVG